MLTAEAFVGRWELRRTIRDIFGGHHGALTGTATFIRRDVTHLTYQEVGKLTLDTGAVLEATRRYYWTFTPDKVEVRFDDDRPFHAFAPSGHAAGTDHPCGEDIYKVRYDFTQWPEWTAVWSVTGPRKDYVSTSHYIPPHPR